MESNALGLLDLLALEYIEENIFRGRSQDIGTGQVFGGQVLGQAIVAAQNSLAEDDDLKQRSVHSVHAYFLRKGDVTAPILYQVDPSRDGRSFSSRRVVAVQHGRPIFHLSASFQHVEPGMDFYHRQNLPGIPEADLSEPVSAGLPTRNKAMDFFDIRRLAPANDTGAVRSWLKTKEPLPADDETHRAVMGYASDLGLLLATLMPHQETLVNAGQKGLRLSMSSIDHAIWFHRSFRADRWFFYDCQSLSTSNARGLARGLIYDEHGVLVASTMQEGLIRLV